MKKRWELKVNPKLRETVAENKTKIERSWKRAKNFEREEKLEAVWCLQLECNWKEWSCTLPITQLLNLHRSQPPLPCGLEFTWFLNSFRGLAGHTLQYFHYKLHNTTCICCNTGVNQRIYRVVYQTHLGRIDRQTPSSLLAGLERGSKCHPWMSL